MTPRHKGPDEAPPFRYPHLRANMQERGGRSEFGARKVGERAVAGKYEECGILAEEIPGEKIVYRRPGKGSRPRRPGKCVRLSRDHGSGDNRAVGDRRRSVNRSSRRVRGRQGAGDRESPDRGRHSCEVGSVVRARAVVVGERRDRRVGRQRARPLGDRRRLLGEQGTERQHCKGGDAVGDWVGKRGMTQRHGTITVDGVAAAFDQSLH